MLLTGGLAYNHLVIANMNPFDWDMFFAFWRDFWVYQHRILGRRQYDKQGVEGESMQQSDSESRGIQGAQLFHQQGNLEEVVVGEVKGEGNSKWALITSWLVM